MAAVRRMTCHDRHAVASDAGDIAGALEIAPYALQYGLTTDHRRTTPTCWLRRWRCRTASAVRDAGESVDLSPLQTTIDRPTQLTFPIWCAPVCICTGLTLRDAGMNAECAGAVSARDAARPQCRCAQGLSGWNAH